MSVGVVSRIGVFHTNLVPLSNGHVLRLVQGLNFATRAKHFHIESYRGVLDDIQGDHFDIISGAYARSIPTMDANGTNAGINKEIE